MPSKACQSQLPMGRALKLFRHRTQFFAPRPLIAAQMS